MSQERKKPEPARQEHEESIGYIHTVSAVQRVKQILQSEIGPTLVAGNSTGYSCTWRRPWRPRVILGEALCLPSLEVLLLFRVRI